MLQKAIMQVIKMQTRFKEIDLEFKSYEDVFQEIEQQIAIDRFRISAKEISKYNANKLMFDIAQGRIGVQELLLNGGGFNEITLKKISSIATK